MTKTKEELKAEEEALLLVKINDKATEAVKAAFEGFKSEYSDIATKAAEGNYSKEEVDGLLKGLGEKIKV